MASHKKLEPTNYSEPIRVNIIEQTCLWQKVYAKLYEDYMWMPVSFIDIVAYIWIQS